MFMETLTGTAEAKSQGMDALRKSVFHVAGHCSIFH